ncbi:MAG: mechanosensitive ion channel domain-containing protein [Synechococcales bacterium]|nr:mechanosensitive ion channel domain-containing protein [Synechococcales bacterium]
MTTFPTPTLPEVTLSPSLQITIIVGLTAIATLLLNRFIPALLGGILKWVQAEGRSPQPQVSPHPSTHPSTTPTIRTLVTRNGHSRPPTRTTWQLLQESLQPYRGLAVGAIALLVLDLVVSLLPRSPWYPALEIPVSLALTITVSWLASNLFKRFFDLYLLDAVVKEGRRLNSEILILAKFSANAVIVVLAVIIFAQTHQINVFGLVASLGIGGLAVAFAAQKTLEQLLGGIVLYLDRPFIVDDYIGLPDGTFGRVESIGLRSTKIRTSGKGTLMVVPNSSLTQINIENFTGAKKVMAIIYLNLYRQIPEEERALIRQVILESTNDIFGIDPRSTDVAFRKMPGLDRTQVQVTFFILGSGEVSMELRRQVLDFANQQITQQLTEYGIAFDIEEPTIYVDSPITI